MKRRMIGVMTAVAMGLSLSGCGANAAPAIETSTAAQEAAPTLRKQQNWKKLKLQRKQKKRTKPQKNQLRTQAAHWWLDLIRIFLLWDF